MGDHTDDCPVCNAMRRNSDPAREGKCALCGETITPSAPHRYDFGTGKCRIGRSRAGEGDGVDGAPRIP